MFSVLASGTRSGHLNRENRQIERNENKGNQETHENENGRLDERDHRAQAKIHFFFVEFGDAGEHRRQGAARFADFNHVESKFGHDASGRKRGMERFAFADFLRGVGDRPTQQFAFNGVARGLQASDERRAARKKRGKRAGELRDLKFQNRFAGDRQFKFHAVNGNAAFFRTRPGEKTESRDEYRSDGTDDEVAIVDGESDEDARGRRERHLHVLIEHGEFRDDDGDEIGDDDAGHGDKQNGIDERGENFLADAGADALIGDVIVEDAGKIAALFAGQNRSGINFRENAGFGDGFRKRLPFADAIANLRNDGTQSRRTGALGEEIQRAENGKAGFDERIELLIENQEV